MKKNSLIAAFLLLAGSLSANEARGTLVSGRVGSRPR